MRAATTHNKPSPSLVPCSFNQQTLPNPAACLWWTMTPWGPCQESWHSGTSPAGSIPPHAHTACTVPCHTGVAQRGTASHLHLPARLVTQTHHGPHHSTTHITHHQQRTHHTVPSQTGPIKKNASWLAQASRSAARAAAARLGPGGTWRRAVQRSTAPGCGAHVPLPRQQHTAPPRLVYTPPTQQRAVPHTNPRTDY